MKFKILETNRGNKSIICDGYSYRFHTSLKNGELSWRCSNKKCKVRMTTDAETSCIIQIKNVHENVSKAIYRKRQKRHPALPKSREDLHTTISNMTIETSKSENFLQINNLDNGIIIFTCRLNLECLCSVDDILWMVPFDVVLSFLHSFTQSMDINGNYIPLVFILLPGKSEELYSCAFSSLLHLCSENGLAFAPSVVHVDFE